MSTSKANSGIVLIATDSVSDAVTVRRNLQDAFEHVVTSTDAQAAADDFERHRPDVLVLAFNKLEKAERYDLGLYRLCPSIQLQPHRTIILCDKEDAQAVYAFCKRQYFDDYVPLW